MSNNKESISVIIPTTNAWEELDLALKSIKNNSDYLIDFCVIVDPDINTGKINSKILSVCQKHQIKPHLNSNNLGPYGSWNKGAELALTDWLVFATDDQYFAPHWDTNLKKYWKPKRLIAGRLVEPGIIPVYPCNLQKDFGTLPSEFQEKEFIAWCASRHNTGFVPDGFFIPMLQNRRDYDALGHYPTHGKFGTSAAVSNDALYIKEALKKGYEFGTAEDSYSYHFQASSWKKKKLKPTIAAVVLTKNEEKNLPATLKSLSWCNDIFVVDSGSTDKTLEIARKYHAKIHKNSFIDFATQRNFALKQVSDFDWVLMIDADEVVDKELAQELISFAKDIYLDGVEIPRKNYIFGKWIKYGDWYPDYRLVFFRPKIVAYEGSVHERVKFIKGSGAVVKANSSLIHHNYENLSEFFAKNLIDYPQIYAASLAEQGVKFSIPEMVSKSIGEFFRRFFLTEGWRDGMYGLTLSLLMGIQTLAAYLYLWEKQGKNEKLTTDDTRNLFKAIKSKTGELTYWLTTLSIETSGGAKKLFHRATRKALKLMQKI